MPSAARKKPGPISEQPEKSVTRSPSKTKPIVIRVTRQSDGCLYTLDIHSRREIEREQPALRVVPDVFIGIKTEHDFKDLHGADDGKIWKQVVMLLTGWPTAELRKKGVELRDELGQRLLGRVF